MTAFLENMESAPKSAPVNEIQISILDLFEPLRPRDRTINNESNDTKANVISCSDKNLSDTKFEKQIRPDLIADGVEKGKISKSTADSLKKMMGDMSSANWDRIEKVLDGVNKVLEKRASPYRLKQDGIAAGHTACHFIDLVDTRIKEGGEPKVVDSLAKDVK